MGGQLRGKGRVGNDIAGEGVNDLSDQILRIAIVNKQVSQNVVKSCERSLTRPRKRAEQIKYNPFSESCNNLQGNSILQAENG